MTERLPLAPGQLLAEKYRIDYVIGERGSGLVVAAEHLALRQHVAIKVLRTSATAEHVERFFREARAAASIASEHVVRVVDLARLESGEPYIVMEMLEGQTLAATLAARGPLPVSEAVDYVLQACEAVGKAHAAGIVHRELAPATLFLTRNERREPLVKVLDFGVCKLGTDSTGGPAGQLTGANALLGSPAHMAPEQWLSASDVDARTDVWALGAITYELLAGRPAFAGADLAAICHAVQHEEPVPLDHLRADVPAELWAVIARSFAKRREARFASAALLGLALSPWSSAVGRSLLGELGKLTADPSRPEQAAAAPTLVGSIHDPRVHVSRVAEALPAARANGPLAPVVAADALPARTASGTIQLAAMADEPVGGPCSDSGQGAGASPSRALPPTLAMEQSEPIVPAARARPLGDAGASHGGSPQVGALLPPAVGVPSVPPVAAWTAPLAPTHVGPHRTGGSLAARWVWIALASILLAAIVVAMVVWRLA